ncbi:50S ribosomal protein L6 [Aquicella lusitana]|uniref:Large ribosomal subunit protein uL6 n=1 Tax=Aquicella lusitana TaxID=254246 RepID=A0A370GTE8_9COXI|nr:50S ribosomal protein L6 [Aquicella lusitana]RDI46962.1 LSU ribosomal protein L6P [Aquicella lusitana]VVC73852.1 50S ribosomal protein L6 [Aquicella lusitana]
MNTRTSRIGRKPVVVPSGVEVKLQDQKLSVKGPKGQLTMAIHPYVHVAIENNEIKVQPNNESKRTLTGPKTKLYRSIAGTTRANIHNVIHGVAQGFERKLVLVGVGYRAQAKGKVLSLSLGFSHPTDFAVPEGITIETPTQTEILVKGINKELVGLVAAQIRSVRGPEPYKGKGVRYANEVIELKETKKK